MPEHDNKVLDYKLVSPSVHIGFVPPNSYIDTSVKVRIPCLLIGCPEVNDDQESTEINLQITAIIYDPGFQQKSKEDMHLQIVPNFDGYISLINILDTVKEWIQRNDGIDNMNLISPIKMRTYEEQPWPYWYGYLAFTVSGSPSPVTRYADVLN